MRSAAPRGWKPLPPVLRGAVDEYNKWLSAYLKETDIRNKIEEPLYHYTDSAGLSGIIMNQEIWFTSYKHMNDPSEIAYGMSIALQLLEEIGKKADSQVNLFCKMVIALFSNENIENTFSFFIASFSRNGDDLGQWRGYGDNGHGFSLGLSQRLFQVLDKPGLKPHENVFVTPVVYGEKEGRKHHRRAIRKAVKIVETTIKKATDVMSDKDVGMPFFDEMARSLIAAQLIFNSLTIKHEAYSNEREVRLIIMGEREKLRAHISTRSRRGDIVPFIKSPMKVQEKAAITEIVVGPCAAVDAEDGVRTLLAPFRKAPGSLVRRSKIPYRAL